MLVVSLITDKQLIFLEDILNGKIKKKDDPRKYSTYIRRIQNRIDHMKRNLLWLSEHRPDIMSDLANELADENLPMKRRAKALIKAVTLFENEPTVIEIISEIYTKHQIELTKRR